MGRAAARLASSRPPIRAAALAWLEATAAQREPEHLALRGPGDLAALLAAARAAAGTPEVGAHGRPSPHFQHFRG